MIRPPLSSLKTLLRSFGYLLALMGAAFGGFPPPRMFAREELPAVVVEHVVDATDLEDLDGWESRWGLRIDRAPQGQQPPVPETPR